MSDTLPGQTIQFAGRVKRFGEIAGLSPFSWRVFVIDLHSHILPGIDDGAADIGVALEMARIAVANGVEVQACTPAPPSRIIQ